MSSQVRMIQPDQKNSVAIHPDFFSEKNIVPRELAESILNYFSRPSDGWYEEKIFKLDGTEETVQRPYSAPIPLWSEFCRSVGMTERELRDAATLEPAIIGRACEVADGIIKEYLVRRGLSGDYNSQFAIFTAINMTDMRQKATIDHRQIDVNRLLDQIEQAKAPADTYDTGKGY